MEVIWKKIDGFDKYMISNKGDILSLNKNKNGRLMKPKEDKDGYLEVGIRDNNGNRKFFRIHRLVAMAFLENPNNLPVVNHKDGNKKNNCVENLEWCTISENTKHGFEVLGRKGHNGGTNKLIAKICVKTNKIINIYNSIHDASKDVGVTVQAISRCANGKSKTSAGFKWKFVDEGVETIETTS